MAMILMTNVIITIIIIIIIITSELSQRILAMLDILTASSSLSFSWTCACSVVQYEIQKIQSNNTKHQSKISICHLWVQSEVIEIPRHCSYLEKTGVWAKTFGNIIVCENLWWSWWLYENYDGTGTIVVAIISIVMTMMTMMMMMIMPVSFLQPCKLIAYDAFEHRTNQGVFMGLISIESSKY